MIMTFEIDSSAIEKAEYDPEYAELYLTYAGGGEYTYFNVPLEMCRQLEAAESAGRFVSANIKGYYDSVRGRAADPTQEDYDEIEHDLKKAVAAVDEVIEYVRDKGLRLDWQIHDQLSALKGYADDVSLYVLEEIDVAA